MDVGMKEMMDNVESAGYDEFLICNANTEMAYWDQLEAVIAAR
jgi:hypothetical protein